MQNVSRDARASGLKCVRRGDAKSEGRRVASRWLLVASCWLRADRDLAIDTAGKNPSPPAPLPEAGRGEWEMDGVVASGEPWLPVAQGNRGANSHPRARARSASIRTRFRVRSTCKMLAEMRKHPGGSVYDMAMFPSVQTRGLAPVRLVLGPAFECEARAKC